MTTEPQPAATRDELLALLTPDNFHELVFEPVHAGVLYRPAEPELDPDAPVEG